MAPAKWNLVNYLLLGLDCSVPIVDSLMHARPVLLAQLLFDRLVQQFEEWLECFYDKWTQHVNGLELSWAQRCLLFGGAPRWDAAQWRRNACLRAPMLTLPQTDLCQTEWWFRKMNAPVGWRNLHSPNLACLLLDEKGLSVHFGSLAAKLGDQDDFREAVALPVVWMETVVPQLCDFVANTLAQAEANSKLALQRWLYRVG